MSKKRRDTFEGKSAIWKRVQARDGGCLLHPSRPLNKDGRDWGPCFGMETPHHLLKEKHGGKYTEENLRVLCVGHNDMVEDYPNAAHAIGLVIKSWETRKQGRNDERD
jgi:hypothetical protein